MLEDSQGLASIIPSKPWVTTSKCVLNGQFEFVLNLHDEVDEVSFNSFGDLQIFSNSADLADWARALGT